MDHQVTPATTEDPIFTFRVLIELDSRYNAVVARCLETGSVATADDADTAEDMIKELLIDELTYSLEHDNLSNLYSSPAPIDVWIRFRDARREGAPSKPVQRAVRRNSQEIPAEITVARIN